MRRLVGRLGSTGSEDTWPDLVEAATFAPMKARATTIATDPSGILKDPIVRRGTSGAGRATLTAEELDAYDRRASDSAPPDHPVWLHRK